MRIQVLGFRLDQEGSRQYQAELHLLLQQKWREEEELELVSLLSAIYGDLNEHVQACEMGERALSLARKVSDRFKIGMLLEGFAFNYNCIGAINRAEVAILESIDIARDSNHLAGLAHRLWIYGCVIQGRDRVKAREVWLESLALHRELNNRQSILWVLGNLAMVDVEDQQFDRAISYLEERLVHAVAVNDTGAVHQTYNWLIRISIAQRDWQAARRLATARMDFEPNSLFREIELGWISDQDNQPLVAVEHYERALTMTGGNQDIELLLMLLLRRPVIEEVGTSESLDRIDGSKDTPFGPTRSEIVLHAIRSVRLRHALTPL
jgi:tetratricopeptide (TPR) repeat protein